MFLCSIDLALTPFRSRILQNDAATLVKSHGVSIPKRSNDINDNNSNNNCHVFNGRNLCIYYSPTEQLQAKIADKTIRHVVY